MIVTVKSVKRKQQCWRTETDKLEALCEKPVPEKLTGKSRLAAEIDIARTVARRTRPRCLAQVSVKFGADTESKRFLNRLSDYLYILARYIEYYSDLSVELSDDHAGALAKTSDNNTDALPEPSDSNTDVLKKTADINEAVIQEVLKRMGIQSRITLDTAKKLIERLEQEAVRRGQRAVIAVCNPEGNPVAVHVMDGAFLVSFDVAMKKAYTAVAVKMSTMELSKIAQPGRTEHLRCAPSPEIKSSAALLQMNPVIRLQNLIFSTKFLTVMIPSWYIQPTENPTH